MIAPKYKMRIELGVLDHLRLNLYSNIPAVLAEAVANAWDADAKKVEINIHPGKRSITTIDNGHGMDLGDINDKFLPVGYRRREAGATKTRLGRHVMGRKGIGKLSLFSIAERIEVHSVETDATGKRIGDPQAFVLDSRKVQEAIEAKDAYHPEELDPKVVKIRKGTRL